MTLGPGLVRHVLSDWHLDGAGAPRAEVLRWTAAGFARIAPEATGVGRRRRERLAVALARASARSSGGRSPSRSGS